MQAAPGGGGPQSGTPPWQGRRTKKPNVQTKGYPMTLPEALSICRSILAAPPCPTIPRHVDRAGRALACVQTLAEVRRG